jgi:hypothetical protein
MATTTSKCNLVPIRVDVTSSDELRIVETILMDPTCWPIPLSPPWEDSLEKNIRHIAHQLLSDLEVQGMGRTVRHFTGRVDLWSAKLQTKIEDCLRPQLWYLAVKSSIPETPNQQPKKIAIRLCVHGINIQEDLLWDPNLESVSPFEFATSMGKELNLSDEAVVAVATTIIEQLFGIPIDSSEDKSTSKAATMGATVMDQKDHVANLAHVVSQHRPI